MPALATTPHTPRVNDAFLQPLTGLVAASAQHRPQLDFTDEHWLRLGLQRVLESVPSGRAFLQEHGPRFDSMPGRSNYFYANGSPRRLDLARDVNRALLTAATLPDRLEHLPELAKYECFALDGHWHQAAAHDARHDGTKMAVGHFYSLDLRGHQLRHLAVGQGLHEHDRSVRETPQTLGPASGRAQGPAGAPHLRQSRP